MRVEEVFAAVGVQAAGKPIPDAWILGKCEVCGLETPLNTMETRDNGQQTEYLCLKCEALVIIVGPVPGLKGGNRFGDWIIKGEYNIVPPPTPT